MAKRIFSKIIRALIIGVISIVLVTIGLDAADHYDDLSESIAGRLFFGKATEPCPEDMMLIRADWGDYCIDKYEASPSMDCPYQQPGDISQSQSNNDFVACVPVSRSDAIPWRSISQDQAAYACAKAGKRLPSNREWSQAALGTSDPNSNWGKDDCQVADNWDSQPGLTGSGKNCVSFDGVYDMIGNVWEWVDGTVVDGFYEDRPLPKAGYVYGIDKTNAFPSDTKETPPEEYYNDYFWIKKNNSRAIARGGYWDNESEAGQYAHYVVTQPTFTGSGVGFRCSKKTNIVQ